MPRLDLNDPVQSSVAEGVTMFKLRGADPSMQVFPFSGTIQTEFPILGTVVRTQVPRLSVERSLADRCISIAGWEVSLIDDVGKSADGSSSRQASVSQRSSDDGFLPPASVKQIIKGSELLLNKWLSVVYQAHSGDSAVRAALFIQYRLVSQWYRRISLCSNSAVDDLLRLYGGVMFLTDSWKCIESYSVKRFYLDIGMSPDTRDLLILGDSPGFAAVRVSDLAAALGLTNYALAAMIGGLMTEELAALVYG